MPLFGGWASSSAATTPATTPVWVEAQTVTTGSSLMNVYQTAQTASALTCQQQAAGAASWYLTQMQQQATTSTVHWVVWEDSLDHAQYVTLAQSRVIRFRERTQQEIQAQAERLRLEAERHAQRVEEITRAVSRSRELLLAHLTAEQRNTFERRGWFVVQGGKTRQRYRINTLTYAGNIEGIDGLGLTKFRLCCHCTSSLPIHDHHLAQKLALELDEENFLRVANRS